MNEWERGGRDTARRMVKRENTHTRLETTIKLDLFRVEEPSSRIKSEGVHPPDSLKQISRTFITSYQALFICPSCLRAAIQAEQCLRTTSPVLPSINLKSEDHNLIVLLNLQHKSHVFARFSKNIQWWTTITNPSTLLVHNKGLI